MKEHILRAVEDGMRAMETLRSPEGLSFIEQAALEIAECFRRGNKLLIIGNGGSLCDAMHFAEELTGYFREKRRAFPAMVCSDPGHLTCTANDSGFERVFERYVEAFGKKGDLLISLTTSGNSMNLLYAIQKAKKMGLKTVSFLGKQGGKMKGMGDLEWHVQGFSTSDRIQEAHMAAIHMIIEMVERELFEEISSGI